MAEEDKIVDERMIAISKKLKQLRKDTGYTNYEHIAWELNMGRAQYHRLEAGKNFTMETLFRILDGYGISLADFCAEFTEKKEPQLEKAKVV
jgi:transcriptional regulator with XRE-family HTH domain